MDVILTSRHGALHLNENKGILTLYRPVKTGSPQGGSRCHTDDQTQCTSLNPLGPRPATALSLQNPMRRAVTVSNDPGIQL